MKAESLISNNSSSDLFYTISHSQCVRMLNHIVHFIVNSHLVEEEFSALLFPQVHFLHSDQFPRGLHCSDAHDARGPFPNLNVVVQVGPWVARIHHHL